VTSLKTPKLDDFFHVQNGSSGDIPSAPPINDYDQDHQPVTHDDTRSCDNSNFTNGLSAKKDHREVNGGVNLADKNDR
jgi:hypothetical protein